MSYLKGSCKPDLDESREFPCSIEIERLSATRFLDRTRYQAAFRRYTRMS